MPLTIWLVSILATIGATARAAGCRSLLSPQRELLAGVAVLTYSVKGFVLTEGSFGYDTQASRHKQGGNLVPAEELACRVASYPCLVIACLRPLVLFLVLDTSFAAESSALHSKVDSLTSVGLQG